MSQIQVGTPVVARSGGPILLVVNLRGDGWANVQWFTDGVVQHECFPTAGLRALNWLERLLA